MKQQKEKGKNERDPLGAGEATVSHLHIFTIIVKGKEIRAYNTLILQRQKKCPDRLHSVGAYYAWKRKEELL